MARGIYEIKLRENFLPALSESDAVDMLEGVTDNARIQKLDVEVSLKVPDEQTMKLFILAKSMYDLDKFTYQEICAATQALVRELGYFADAEDLADTICRWTERVSEDMTLTEFEEWLIG